ELAVAGHDPDILAVRNRRGRSGVLFAEELVPAIDLAVPADGTVLPIHGYQKDLVWTRLSRSTLITAPDGREPLFGRSDKDCIFPDDRSGRAPARHLGAPVDILRLTPV